MRVSWAWPCFNRPNVNNNERRRCQHAVSEYVALMKTEAGVDKSPVVTVEEDPAKCLSAGW